MMNRAASKGSNTGRKKHLAGAVACFSVFVLFCLLHGPLLLAPDGYLPSTMFHDFFSLFYPAAEIFRALVTDGEWPLWNPYAFGGMPFLASIQMGLLYPPNWLHVIVSPARAFNILLVAHTLFAGIGTWLYCRSQGRSGLGSLFAAVAFAASGRVVLHQYAGHPQIVYSAAWLPFIFWTLDRCLRHPSIRTCCGLSFVLAMHFLAGMPMFSLLMCYLIPLYLLVYRWQKPRVLTDHKGISVSRPLIDNSDDVQNPANTGVADSKVRIDWSYGRLAMFFGGAGIIALGISATQILMTWEYMQESHRGSGLDYAWSTTSSYPPTNLVTFLVPGFLGDHVNFAYWGETSLWESTAFCGIVTLILASIAVLSRFDRMTAFWSVAGLLAMLVAMGKYSYLYDFCYAYAPGVSLFRGVAKLSVFVTLALAVLASRGFDLICSREAVPRAGRFFNYFMLVAAIMLFVWAFTESGLKAPAPGWWETFFNRIQNATTFTLSKVQAYERAQFVSQSYEFMLSKVLWSSVCVIVSSVAAVNRVRFGRSVPVVLTALLCVEVYVFASPYMQLSDSAPYREPAERVRAAINDDSSWRFCCVTSDDALMNQFGYERLQSPGGIEASLLKRYTRLFSILTGADPQMMTYLTVPVVHEALFDLLNVKYYAAPAQAPRVGDTGADRLISRNVFEKQGVSYSLYENIDVLPRAFIVHQLKEIDYEEAGGILLPQLMIKGTATASFVEGRLPFPLGSVSDDQKQNEACHVTNWHPSGMTIDVKLAAPAAVLVVENHYPGWVAFVDGVRVEMLPANLCMRAVPVKAGEHRIEIRYAPSSFRLGGWLSIATLTMMALVCTFPSLVPSCIGGLRIPVTRNDSHGGASRFDASAAVGTLSAFLFYAGSIVVFFFAGGFLYSRTADVLAPGQPPLWSRQTEFGLLTMVTLVVIAAWQTYRRSQRRMVFGVVLLSVMFPLTLICVEFLTRGFIPDWPARSLHGVAPDVAAQSWGKPGASGGVGVNAWGQRDYDRTVAPKSDIKRIAFIGDSFLEETSSVPLSVQTEKGLNAAPATASSDEGRLVSPVEVLNLGVSATSPDEYYFRLREVALPLGIEKCVMFVYAGNDFVEVEQSLDSFLGIAAVSPRGSFLSTLGLSGINHLLMNQRRPVLKAWLGSENLRKEEELRFLTIAESDDTQVRRMLLSAATVVPEDISRLEARLNSPEVADFLKMCRAPDAGLFRSYYLSQALHYASKGSGKWDENSEESAFFWVSKSAELCKSKGIEFTLVIVPEGFSVDPRMVEQWNCLTDMRQVTSACRTAAERLRSRAMAAGIDTIDLHEPFNDVPGTYLNMDGHWSDKGVSLAAEILIQRLRESLKQ